MANDGHSHATGPVSLSGMVGVTAYDKWESPVAGGFWEDTVRIEAGAKTTVTASLHGFSVPVTFSSADYVDSKIDMGDTHIFTMGWAAGTAAASCPAPTLTFG